MTPAHHLSLFACLSLLAPALAQGLPYPQLAESTAGLVAVHQAMLDAQSDVVVLNVAAHPDDESSRTNTMLRQQHGMRVVTVYSTYGDGGQNAIGREIGPALARIRVRETLRASSMMGVQVRWLGMPDFGFSKTLEETLRIWGEDRLKDAMREVIDKVDPDVIITNHSLTRGHGHHRASIWAVIEILKERAELGRYVPQLYARCGVDKAQLAFDPGQLDLARGETYAATAYAAWTQHVSQGPWRPHDPVRVGLDYWQVVYPEGVTKEQASDLARWSREPIGGVRLPGNLPWQPDTERRATVLARLEQVRKDLRDAVNQIGREGMLRRAHVLRRRADALQQLYLAMVGVRAEVWLDTDEVAQGGFGKGYVVMHGHERIQNLKITCDDEPAEPVRKPVQSTPFDDRPPSERTLPRRPTGVDTNGGGAEAQPQAPARPVAGSAGGDEAEQDPAAEAPQAEPLPGRFEYRFACEYIRGDELPTGPEPSYVDVEISFEVDGMPFLLIERLPYTPVAPIALTWDREVVLVPRGKRSERVLSIGVENHRDMGTNSGVRLQMGPGIEATATPSRLALSKEQSEARILVRAAIDADEMTPDAGLAVGFRDATVRLPLRVVDVTVPDGMHVALVRGPEDSTERTLDDLGIPFTSLDRDALVTANLEDFSVVLLDIRAYHHRPELAEVRERLLQYCRGGGRVVAMYHKPGEWNEREGHPLLAPFPLAIGNDRVTEEDAPVTLLQPEARLMTWPHRIAAADFVGWVQERGLNFPSTWDSAWSPMLAMKDSGEEKSLEGSLLYTQYGKGDFVYCSLSLYRQLRTGNPGAVRLLVNFLAR